MLYTLAGAAGAMLTVVVLVILVRVGSAAGVVPDRFSTIFLPFAMTAAACLVMATATAPDRTTRAAASILLAVVTGAAGLATAWVARSASDNCLALAPPTDTRLDVIAGTTLSATGTVTCRWNSSMDAVPDRRTSYRFFDKPRSEGS